MLAIQYYELRQNLQIKFEIPAEFSTRRPGSVSFHTMPGQRWWTASVETVAGCCHFMLHPALHSVMQLLLKDRAQHRTWLPPKVQYQSACARGAHPSRVHVQSRRRPNPRCSAVHVPRNQARQLLGRRLCLRFRIHPDHIFCSAWPHKCAACTCNNPAPHLV
jgi:hypothetical protein